MIETIFCDSRREANEAAAELREELASEAQPVLAGVAVDRPIVRVLGVVDGGDEALPGSEAACGHACRWGVQVEVAAWR